MHHNTTTTDPTANAPAPAVPPKKEPESPGAEFAPMPPVIAELIREQGEMSDAKFCREYNFSYADSNWSKIRRWVDADPTSKGFGTLFYKGDISAVLTECEAMLRRIRERKVTAAKTRKGMKFIAFPHFQLLLDRVKVLMEDETTQNRGLLYLAESGGGKTGLCRETTAQFGGIMIEARESWRDSYYAAVSDVCDKLKTPGKYRDKRGAEKELIEKLNTRKQVLCIDEAEYFGSHSLNLIKLILNQTPTIVLICAIPELWNRVKTAAWVESMQIVRRVDHVERLSLIHPNDILKFVETRGVNLNGTADASCKLIARAANAFGRYDLITRVMDKLSDQEPKHLSDVESTVQNIEAMLRGGGAR